MKLILEHYKTIYSIETEFEDLGIDEHINNFFGLLHQAGFHQDTIKETIIELAESFKK
jgi:hypothetical protein